MPILGAARLVVSKSSADGPTSGTVLGGVASDDAFADCLVENKHEGRDGVLDRGAAVFGLPLVDRAVDQPGAHHGHGQVAECRHDPQLEARGVRIVGGRRIDAACPAIADVLEEGRERLTGVATGTRRGLHPLDPTFGLVERRMGALGALTAVG